jgi:acetyltransferase-like isoleucine patch superfamily enzyme
MISRNAIVESDQIGENTKIAEFSIVRKGAKIGKNVVIHSHVVINDGVSVGDGVEIFPFSVLGKEPKGAGATARTPTFLRTISIGNNSSIGPSAVIFYDVKIGENTLIGDGASIREQCVVGSKCIISRYVTINYNSSVGDRTKIMDLTHITGNTVIEADVFISTGVSTVNDNGMGQNGYSEDAIRGPTIETGAMIGAGAILLPSIKIGKAALVASGAVVTKNVAANTRVAGVPAKPMT